MLAATGGDYSYALKVQETLTAMQRAPTRAAAEAVVAAQARSVAFASAVDIAQHMLDDDPPAAGSPRPCKRARTSGAVSQ